ncbi:MAG: aldo/keto reductase [Acidimicrobiia bacterium]|nr:aldo/keto reductase [Acidimicrobiia bacterium]MBV8984210.1 aldo/keto reductase [Acidimicrobiia bacterium]
MRYVDVGGTRMSAIGLGCWQFGSMEWGYGKEYLEKDAIDIVHRALDLGVTLVDTAEIYGFGKSERAVGRALEGRRGEAFIATKIMPVLPIPPVVVQRGHASLRRLGVDVIDLYQIHQPNPLVPVGVQMQGMRRLQDEGVVKHVGVSNFSLAKWKAAEASHGSPVISNQVQYSLAVRGPDRTGLVQYAADNDRVIIAYSPLAQGFLSAKYDATNAPGGVRAANSLFLPENLERGHELITALREVAKAHDATPAQIALAWVIRRKNVVAIPGASSVSQLEKNAAAADIDLTDDEDERLTTASDNFNPVNGVRALPKILRKRLPF